MENEILDETTHDKIINVQYATFLDRFLAVVLDFLILTAALGAFVYLGYTQKNLVLVLVGGVIGLLYQPVMEGIWGATLGKMIMKISMVDSDLDQLDLGQSFLKNAIYIIYRVLGILTQFWVFDTVAFAEAEGLMESFGAGQGNPYEIITLVWMVVILISVFALFASNEKQTLHDRLAGSYCVKNSSLQMD